MSRTLSTMMPLGTRLPAFELPEDDGTTWCKSPAPATHAALAMFICNHSPYDGHIGS